MKFLAIVSILVAASLTNAGTGEQRFANVVFVSPGSRTTWHIGQTVKVEWYVLTFSHLNEYGSDVRRNLKVGLGESPARQLPS